MVDQETESLWSHLLGTAMQGPLEGSKLEAIPSTMTDWGSWRERYPSTTVMQMSRTTNEYRRGMHLNEIMLPSYPLPDALVIGLVGDGKARCWRFDSLRIDLVINDRFAGQPVVAVFEPKSGTATVFSRIFAGQEMSFTFKGGKLVDDRQQSEWDPITGEAADEAHEGRQLRKLPGIVSLKPAWIDFHPETTVWSKGS